MRTTAPRTRTAVASVTRAMRVLTACAEYPGGVALTRLSGDLGYGKASLSKIMVTMEREGFVRRDAAGLFHLSWRLLSLAFGHAERVGFSGICAPVLQALADETGELVQLAVIEGEHVLFVAKAEGAGQALRLLPLLGLVAPTHATASGKLWLASLPEAQAMGVIRRQGLARVTPRTITSAPRLLAELRRVRRNGYAITDGELDERGRAVAAPILHVGAVVGAIAVSGPSFRLPLTRLAQLVPRVQQAARELQTLWPRHAKASDFGLAARLPGRNGRVTATRSDK